MFYDFPDIGNNTPNWLSYFSEGLKTPTSYILYVYVCIYIYIQVCHLPTYQKMTMIML